MGKDEKFDKGWKEFMLGMMKTGNWKVNFLLADFRRPIFTVNSPVNISHRMVTVEALDY